MYIAIVFLGTLKFYLYSDDFMSVMLYWFINVLYIDYSKKLIFFAEWSLDIMTFGKGLLHIYSYKNRNLRCITMNMAITRTLVYIPTLILWLLSVILYV